MSSKWAHHDPCHEDPLCSDSRLPAAASLDKPARLLNSHGLGVYVIPSVPQCAGRWKKLIFASFEGFLFNNKILCAKTILTKLAKQKFGKKLHFQVFYGLLKLENAWLTIGWKGSISHKFLEICVSKQNIHHYKFWKIIKSILIFARSCKEGVNYILKLTIYRL